LFLNQDGVVSFRARIPFAMTGYDAVVEGAETSLIVDRPGFHEDVAPFYGSSAVPPGGLGTGCETRDGWRAFGRGFVYRNLSGARPPGCQPESMRLRVLRLTSRRDGTTAVRGQVKPGYVNYLPDGTASLAIVLGQGPVPIGDGRCGTASAPCVGTVSALRCPFP
jgi:hypothetical protein